MKETKELKEHFLRCDFCDSLKWLFVGAVTWHANPPDKDRDYLRAMGMFTSLTQARALYEFFNHNASSPPCAGEPASAKDFSPGWQAPGDTFGLYSNYMKREKPAQRRVFHLVYGRDTAAGGSVAVDSEEVKSRVLDFAKDLRDIAKDFARSLTGTFEQDKYRELVECALAKSVAQAGELARRYRVQNPI